MRLHVLASFVCLCAGSLAADQITLSNGDRVSGTVVTADEKVVTVKTAWGGEVKIDRSQIASIITDQPLNVTLKDGGTVKAKVDASGGSVKLAKEAGGVETVQAAALTALRNDAAQKAFEREQERLNHPRLNDFWSGFLSFGLANSSGNSSTTTISTAASAVRAAGKNKLQLNFSQIYATQSTTQPYGATASRMSGNVRLDRNLSSRIFLYGNNGYDFDRFLDLNLRVNLGGGFGYHTWKTPRGYLDFSGGGNWNRETFDITGASRTYQTSTRNSGEMVVGQEFGYQPYSKLKLFERLAFAPNLTQTGEYRMIFDATASVPIMKWFEWNVGFSSRYLSNPLAGKKNGDNTLTMGVRATFDQTRR
jgi:putative salt-induced outer membrane protein YdiY